MERRIIGWYPTNPVYRYISRRLSFVLFCNLAYTPSAVIVFLHSFAVLHFFVFDKPYTRYPSYQNLFHFTLFWRGVGGHLCYICPFLLLYTTCWVYIYLNLQILFDVNYCPLRSQVLCAFPIIWSSRNAFLIIYQQVVRSGFLRLSVLLTSYSHCWRIKTIQATGNGWNQSRGCWKPEERTTAD